MSIYIKAALITLAMLAGGVLAIFLVVYLIVRFSIPGPLVLIALSATVGGLSLYSVNLEHLKRKQRDQEHEQERFERERRWGKQQEARP